MSRQGTSKNGDTRRFLRCIATTLLLSGCERGGGGRSDPTAVHPSKEPTGLGVVEGGPSPSASREMPTSPVPLAKAAGGALGDATDDGPRVIRFPWRPARASADAYAMDEPEDQHRIVLARGAAAHGAYPVLVAFHGQPKRGEAPRNYAFAAKVMDTTARAIQSGEVRPLVLVLPVFRYFGTNWPDFDVELFRAEVDRRLGELGVAATAYYAVGHSGAAGCGGDGMNRIHRMRPLAVGFFDTCLGRGWQSEVERLRRARIRTLLIHSLETAAFSPRQATEYLSTFDFGRAYGPAGLSPVACPSALPNAPLRDQPFRCSSDEQGTTRGLIVDSGEGEEGHNALIPIALEYFLKQYVGLQ